MVRDWWCVGGFSCELLAACWLSCWDAARGCVHVCAAADGRAVMPQSGSVLWVSMRRDKSGFRVLHHLRWWCASLDVQVCLQSCAPLTTLSYLTSPPAICSPCKLPTCTSQRGQGVLRALRGDLHGHGPARLHGRLQRAHGHAV
jgi:hypothetical protein